jgi:hypothetical protein
MQIIDMATTNARIEKKSSYEGMVPCSDKSKVT